MGLNLYTVIERLKSKRKIFVSEADFQLELAWNIRELYPEAQIRLEFCPDFAPSMRVDILVLMDDRWIPIELKYKTKAYWKVIDGELFSLKNHAAQDLGRYDYLRDLQRLEYLKENAPLFEEGYTVFLTNDQSYTKNPRDPDCAYKEFALGDGATKTGVMRWGERASAGTMKYRQEPISLKGTYNINWQPFSNLDDSSAGSFFILVNRVK